MPAGSAQLITPLRELLPDLRAEPGVVRPATADALTAGFPDLPNLPNAWELEMSSLVTTSSPAFYTVPSSGPLATPGLRDGCYRITFHPALPHATAWPACQGTLRWESPDGRCVVASADLYRSPNSSVPSPSDFAPTWNPEAAAASDIPVFPRDQYHAYLRLGSSDGSTLLSFAKSTSAPLPHTGPTARTERLFGTLHRLRSIEPNLWEPGEPVVFSRLPSPSGTKRSNHNSINELCDYARFELSDASGTHLGELHAQWISPFFRDAVVELDAEGSLPIPEGSRAGETWPTVFARAGWRIRTETGHLQAPTPPSGRWSYAEIHQAMVRSRAQSDSDSEWRYHVSAVGHFAEADAPIGIAFDHEAMDLNGIPREGVAVYAKARMPADPMYGAYAGRVIHETPDLYFHIAVHEVGHAMGLYHNHVGYGLMDQVSGLAEKSRTGVLTRSELEPRFAPEDIFRLRHLPDIHVRPGGTDFQTVGVVDNHNEAHEAYQAFHRPKTHAEPTGNLMLHLGSPSPEIPIGAPLRIDFELFNRSGVEVGIPARLSLATPFVRGWVVSSDGTENEFRSLFKVIHPTSLAMTKRGASRDGSLTLLRGRNGALTSRPGRHFLWLEVSWHHQGTFHCARQRFTFEVTDVRTRPDLRRARRLLRTPEALGFLVFGECPAFAQGAHAIDDALESSEFGPHFAFIKAKAVAERTSRAAPDLELAAELLGPARHLDVLNRRERARADRICRAAAVAAELSMPASPLLLTIS